MSGSEHLKRPVDGTASFHCKVKHLGRKRNLSSLTGITSLSVGDRYIVWRRGIEVLATGPLVVTVDPRIRVEKHQNGNRLVLNSIKKKDAGDYVCQVATFTN